MKRLGRIERIGKPAPLRGAGHKLRDALRAGRTDSVRFEAALLPDQPLEEIVR